MKRITIFCAIIIAPILGFGQCSISNTNPGNTNATTCVCPSGGGTNCDLIPDISIAKLPLNQSSNYTEYPQVCSPSCSGNDGRLRIGVSTPIIGYGPLESRGTTKYVCGTDTVDAGTLSNIPSTCPSSGLPPKQLINQRIYRKNGNQMTYWERPAGSMTYHASHGHQHVDDWGIYTLRSNNGNPNPLNWPIIGTGSKLGFCLIDLGNCTSSSGYCTDNNGNTLNNTNIPNYGLGGGNYGCNNTVQGITNGYMDTYSQSLDGMWINIPPGICNGTYWLVIQIDPYNYFLETDETNNVVAVPITLTKQSPAGIATISANKSMPICSTDNVTLTANSGTSYLWNTGATTQSITVSTAGNYTVTVTNTCGTASSSPFTVSTTGPVAPSTTNASVCGSGSMTLTASGSGTINWYNSSSGGSLLGTGNSFVTPFLTSTTNYFADATTSSGGQTYYCLPSANTIGSGAQYTGSQYQIFNVLSSSTLKAVKIYANAAGSLTVQMQNSAGTTIASSTVSVPAGESRVTLNFSLTPGSDYRLTRSGSFSLYRNNGGVAYPYNINNLLSITGSSAGSGYYYFFYDWEVITPVQSCTSTRSQATANVLANPTVSSSGNAAICSGASTQITASGASTYSWSPSTGLSSTSGSTVTANPASTTTYTITGTAANGCTGTTTVTITVNNNPTVGVTPNSTICKGESIQLNASGASTYLWSPGTGLSSTSGSSVTASPTGTITYTVVGTNANGCTGSNQVTITVNQPPTVGISPSTTSICTGQSATLTASGASSYSWSPSTGLSSTSGSTVTANPPSTTTYTITGTAANGCTGTTTVTVTVNNNPTVGVTPNSSICKGESIQLNASGASTYLWSPGTGLSSTTGSSVSASPTGTTTYTVIGTNANGCTGSNQVTITVNQPPTVGISPSTTSICTGQSATLTASGASTYSWSPATGLNTTQGAVVIATPSVTTTYTVTGTAANGCTGTSTITIEANVGPVPSQPGSMSGLAKVCPGTNGVAYSVATVSGATSYSWTVPNGASVATGAGTKNITVNYSGSFASGSVCVTADNNCGSSIERCKTISKDVPNIPASITGNKNGVCNGVESYTAANVNNATSYNWILPANTSIIGGQGTANASIQFNSGFVSDNLCVTANNYCGPSNQRCITVKSIPLKPTAISGPATVCANQQNTIYAVTPTYGATNYLWSVPTGATGPTFTIIDPVTISVNWKTKGGNVGVVASNACGSAAKLNYAVTMNCKLGQFDDDALLFSLAPNPAVERTEILINSNNVQKSMIKISDLLGKEMFNAVYDLNPGENGLSLNLKGLKPGLYFVTVIIDNESVSRKLVIE